MEINGEYVVCDFLCVVKHAKNVYQRVEISEIKKIFVIEKESIINKFENSIFAFTKWNSHHEDNINLFNLRYSDVYLMSKINSKTPINDEQLKQFKQLGNANIGIYNNELYVEITCVNGKKSKIKLDHVYNDGNIVLFPKNININSVKLMFSKEILEKSTYYPLSLYTHILYSDEHKIIRIKVYGDCIVSNETIDIGYGAGKVEFTLVKQNNGYLFLYTKNSIIDKINKNINQTINGSKFKYLKYKHKYLALKTTI